MFCLLQNLLEMIRDRLSVLTEVFLLFATILEPMQALAVVEFPWAGEGFGQGVTPELLS